MKNTTLCHIEKEGKYLMMHRIKKENDLNHEKWVGIGGKFEDKESPEECVLRETYEETGLILTDFKLRGIVTFVSDKWETEYMHIFSAYDFEGEQTYCDEGVLEWVDKKKIYGLPIWVGDKIFLRLIEKKDSPFFSLKLEYVGDTLINAKLDGKTLDLKEQNL